MVTNDWCIEFKSKYTDSIKINHNLAALLAIVLDLLRMDHKTKYRYTIPIVQHDIWLPGLASWNPDGLKV